MEAGNDEKSEHGAWSMERGESVQDTTPCTISRERLRASLALR